MCDQNECLWIAQECGAHPKFAVHAGVDGDSKLYVARSQTRGTKIPGKLHVSHGVTYICYDGKEEGCRSYEVLTAAPGSVSWVSACNGQVPANAVPGGEDPACNETYYIGRAIHSGTVTVGKIHPSHGCLYVPYGGGEHKYTEYEVLVKNVYGQFLERRR